MYIYIETILLSQIGIMVGWLLGIWLSVVFAEILAIIVSIICFAKNRKQYGYI